MRARALRFRRPRSERRRIATIESSYVHDRKLPLDGYLFSLQSKFLVTLIRGGERAKFYRSTRASIRCRYVRPATNADSLLGRPNGARKQATVLPPNGLVGRRTK